MSSETLTEEEREHMEDRWVMQTDGTCEKALRIIANQARTIEQLRGEVLELACACADLLAEKEAARP